MNQTTHATSPKQPQRERNRDWYPYYAGFTERFVEAALSDYAPGAKTVLDPWNGSGTTTATCARRGLFSTGVDLNPALTLIARARLTPCSVADTLTPLALKILSATEPTNPHLSDPDLLTVWLHPSAASRIRALQAAIHVTLTDLPPTIDELGPNDLAARLPVLACFYYSALFAATRDILRPFRASNPTWVKEAPSYRHRLAPKWTHIEAAFLRQVVYLSQRLSFVAETSIAPLADIRTASATHLPFGPNSFDAALTSPPYATRIDYVRGMLPELAVLGASREDIASIRRLSTGSPVVRESAVPTLHLSSGYSRTLIRSVRSHGSKGSHSYYYPWIRNYIISLQQGLQETARVVATRGSISIVVQDSHYKDIHIDLQAIVTEIMASVGRQLLVRRDYRIRHHRAWMNARANRYLKTRRNMESLLVFH